VRSTLTEAERSFVRWARVARLATVGPDGPHVVPVSPVLDGDDVLFASEMETAKIRNIRADARVALVFDDYVEDWDALRQVMITGRATILRPGAEWERGRALLYEKYLQYEVQAPIGEGDTVLARLVIEDVRSSGF
jgi:nitroimidazol reductase NimA-like FMN-containing flavoprotein (pyridoxamine 5'-phosphate oxidase superfamily)